MAAVQPVRCEASALAACGKPCWQAPAVGMRQRRRLTARPVSGSSSGSFTGGGGSGGGGPERSAVGSFFAGLGAGAQNLRSMLGGEKRRGAAPGTPEPAAPAKSSSEPPAQAPVPEQVQPSRSSGSVQQEGQSQTLTFRFPRDSEASPQDATAEVASAAESTAPAGGTEPAAPDTSTTGRGNGSAALLLSWDAAEADVATSAGLAGLPGDGWAAERDALVPGGAIPGRRRKLAGAPQHPAPLLLHSTAQHSEAPSSRLTGLQLDFVHADNPCLQQSVSGLLPRLLPLTCLRRAPPRIWCR
jgi:hypothetical protein